MNESDPAPAPPTARRRVTVLQLPAFAEDEPIYCEPVHGLDDVLLSGSDDEYYDEHDGADGRANARIRRIEEQARLFLEGRRPRLISASLRGPFGKEAGWQNPWRGGSSQRERVLKEKARPACRRETTSSLVALAEPKKRSAGTDWLRRKNLKRMKPTEADDDDRSAVSPTALRVVGRALESPVSLAHMPDIARSPLVPANRADECPREDSIEIDDTMMADVPSTDDDVMEDEEAADNASQQIEAKTQLERDDGPVEEVGNIKGSLDKTPAAVDSTTLQPSEETASEPVHQPSTNDDANVQPEETAGPSNVAEAAIASSGEERLATQFQSPWFRESQWQLPAPSSPPALATTPRIATPTQNPWAESAPVMSSSQPNLPTSPCSPGQGADLLSLSQEPTLPSLPVPIPSARSSGTTAPSTPDTKHSSLPTPDVTVSIKSFRRFRSPTPTPQPRRRRNKAGPPSILKQTRQTPGMSASGQRRRRVHFVDEAGDSEADEAVTAAAAEAEAADEQDFIEAGLSGTSRGRTFTCHLRANASSLKTPRRTGQRAVSPPPQDRALMASLPSEVDKFQGHFASVAGRAEALPTTTEAAHSYFATKADTDTETGTLQQITSQQSSAAPSSPDTGRKPAVTVGGKENTQAASENPVPGSLDGAADDDDAESVDDVQDVIDNLDDFLGMWDMDAELAQVRSSRV